MLGEKLKNLGYGTGIYKEPELISVKVPVFSTHKLGKVEVSLGPEMKSTGEVLGVGRTLNEALFKGFMASGMYIKESSKTILATIKDKDKKEFLDIAKDLKDLGYNFVATEGTAKLLKENSIEANVINKIKDNNNNILKEIEKGYIDLVINTPTKGNDSTRDGFNIRRSAIEHSVPVITSLDALKAMVRVKKEKINVQNVEIFNI